MSLALTTDLLLQLVGKQVKNAREEYLGEIIEITRNSYGDRIEYVILKSSQLLDREDRYFAIPASSTLLRITEAGEIILTVSKDDLHLANGITPDKCPSPNFRMNPAVFELFEYNEPQLESQME